MNSAASSRELRALHRLLTRVRSQAYQDLPAREIGEVLDDAQYLTGLLLDGPEALAQGDYRQVLVEIEARYRGFEGLVAAYDEPPAPPAAPRGAAGITPAASALPAA